MSRSHDFERKSSAVTLSDMEMFIFPELIYSLVLANMMSPRVWLWRDDSWFDGLLRMKPYRRITRLRQYIMDHYLFNLDLDTWGLTDKQTELARFQDFVDPDTLAQSNALFGYEGDKYYFDIDIRTHFGLDKYEGDIIPYWKTETVEAMDAFRHKPNYGTGAGECVSLSTLYAAALFIVARIPLKDLYLMATPLHSQNFIDVNDGVLTNNRRLVTKNMWFNGTALSSQARRALENERVTIVAHQSGVIHQIYDQASIDADVVRHFAKRLRSYLSTGLTGEILGNFLRSDRDLQRCFQMRWKFHKTDHFIPMERVFAYEHGSPYMVTDNTREKLMDEIEMEEFRESRIARRIVFNDVEDFVQQNDLDITRPADRERLKHQFASECLDSEMAIESLFQFCCISPRLPDIEAKKFTSDQEGLGIDEDMDREEIIERLDDIKERNTMAALAFYAYRDLNRTEPEPFLCAATERNPVSVAAASELDPAELLAKAEEMPDTSIYDEDGRLAQPDEVWNYGRGDGAEKAVLMANVLHHRAPDDELTLEVGPDSAVLKTPIGEYSFTSSKALKAQTWKIPPEIH